MASESSPVAHLVFLNGAVYTADVAQRWASAVAVCDGQIVYVGDNDGVRGLIGPNTKVIDLKGKMLLPGFNDCHVHPIVGGIELARCRLNGLVRVEEIFDVISLYAKRHPESSWIVGGGWGLPVFEGANPKRYDLDQLVSNRPVYLESQDIHSAWVNSKALAIAGISKDTPDPPLGHIERDAHSGEPSGCLREAAMLLVRRCLPTLEEADYLEGLRRAQRLANGFGITCLQDANVDDEFLKAYQELEGRGELTVRVVAALHVDPEKDESQIEELKSKRGGAKGPLVRVLAAKMFADGVIESHTAALLEPYLNGHAHCGELNFSPELFSRIVTHLDKEGFQVHVHAIGDRAIRTALDAFEAARRANGRADARHHIAHLELIAPQDLPRFSKLGVIANFQPFWAHSDQYITQFTEPVLGVARSQHLYPIGSMSRTGAVIAAGSDWPVTSLNPLEAIQVAVTRRQPDDSEGKPWLPEERVDLATMLTAYTIGGAYVNHLEKTTGSIEVGKVADLIVLERNLFEIPPQQIHNVKVLLTLLEGKEVFRDSSLILM
ncbi:MAG: amidohydrolase [Candidatus Melainabacteria bacterium]|nr:amidohydrolase [Candidatus Melainabacteria bacterium]